MPAPNRLPPEGNHRFSGSEVSRTGGFTFRLDGREVYGLPGDTLLTAALASGIIGAGLHDGSPLALDERFAPPVLPRGTLHEPTRALPMARTPAAAALDLVTLPQAMRSRLRQRLDGLRALLPVRARRLGLGYDGHAAPTDPWFDSAPEQQLTTDVVVIGGGLAGLGAALAAGRRGAQVMLIERRQWLGGDARYFGSTDAEDSPNEMVGRLAAALASLENVKVLTRADAFALFEGSIRLNQVQLETGVPVSRVLSVAAPRIVLATGTIERLPVFAGNRLPGVVTARAAFHRADRFGVWIGHKALLSTAASVAYRVATMAKDAGIAIERIADTRLDPQSRFVEFGKAYGIPLSRSVTPHRAVLQNRRGGLSIELMHVGEGQAREAETFEVDQLVVAAGSQPDLSLWHMAGGSSRWQAAAGRLEAEGALEGIELAGAVAGYRNAAACIASGEAATARLFNKPAAEIEDRMIDPAFESPDDPTPIGSPDPEAEAGAYLDGGASLALRPTRHVPAARRRRWQRGARLGLGDEARPLGVNDVAAGVQLGVIPPNDAAIVAQERCVTPGDVVDAGREHPVAMRSGSGSTSVPPAYLAGRFGARTSTWVVSAPDNRDFEVGCLVYADADQSDPAAAVGAVFAAAPGGRKGGLAVIGKWPISEGDVLFVRDISAAVRATLIDPLRPIEPATPAAAPAVPASTAAALAMLAGGSPAQPKKPAPSAAESTSLPEPALSAPGSAQPAIEASAPPTAALPALPKGVAPLPAETTSASMPEVAMATPAPEPMSSAPGTEAAPLVEATLAPVEAQPATGAEPLLSPEQPVEMSTATGASEERSTGEAETAATPSG